ncbi:MAG: histidine phosphatase family protein [Propionibacteriaceae bacterium]|jgi:phosphohistidine phosphatase|nr:histidine phosphatase family protein [Propionibacteriaceae bacterium]
MDQVKTVFVIRHAKSDWTTGVADYARGLTSRGRRDACALGPRLALYQIDLVWCSGAERTTETWEQACLGGASAVELDRRRGFYGTWASALLSEMACLDEAITSLAIVNHQPLVSDLVSALAQPSPLVSQAANHFPTAGLAILTYRGPWASLRPRGMALESFERVRADDPD